MPGVAMSALRVQGGHERATMRAFPPLDADHPMVLGGYECAVCGGSLVAGDVTTVIPLGPGEDADDQRKARDGRWYSAYAVPAHAACAGIDPTPTEEEPA